MAKPRIFISSTYYDLKYIRASLDIFIESLGYESILSEKGDIAFTPDSALDESCYREVETVDIFVIIIGGRYGTEASSEPKKINKNFFDKYESITKKEFDAAIAKDISTYILIESNVYAEYRTYLRNKENAKINYAHVDSVNIFSFIEEILSKPRNNPVQHFEKFEQIEQWLRDQWAGLFRELINRKSQQNQIKSLASEISELQEVNKTLRTYLEALLTSVKPNESNKLIEAESKRLDDISIRKDLERNAWVEHSRRKYNISFDELIDTVIRAKSFDGFINLMKSKEVSEDARHVLTAFDDARRDLNEIRKILGLKPFTGKPTER